MITRMISSNVSKSLEDDAVEQEPSEPPVANDAQEPEYIFEGFILAFSQKVMLTPIKPNQPAYKQL